MLAYADSVHHMLQLTCPQINFLF